MSPYLDLAGLGLLAPFLAPFFAVFFASWLQFQIRNENKQLLQSKFAIMFAAGTVLGLSCMIALTPVLLDLPFSVTVTSLVVALAIAPLLAAEALSRKLTACQQAGQELAGSSTALLRLQGSSLELVPWEETSGG